MKAKSLKKLLVIKEICCWLPSGLDGRKVCRSLLILGYDATASSNGYCHVTSLIF